jgi:uncharacterized damage-inducible protein DinB
LNREDTKNAKKDLVLLGTLLMEEKMLTFNHSLVDHFKRLLAYDQWAMDLLMKDVEAMPTPDPTALGRISHILAAEEIWLSRLLGENLSGITAVWPERGPAECRQKLAELGKKWKGYLNNLKDEDFGKIISYKNTKGQAYQMAVGGILTQAFDHATYHRGQIATAIKKAGGEPHSPGFYGFLLEQSN